MEYCYHIEDFIQNPAQYKIIHFQNFKIRDVLLWKQFCATIKFYPIEHIIIQYVTLTAHHARDLADTIGACKFLHTLKLEQNNMFNKAIYFIARGIANNNSIQNLYINANKFDNVGFYYLIKALQINSNIELLYLWNNNNISENGYFNFANFIRNNNKLLVISLSGNKIYSSVREQMIKALQDNFMMEECFIDFENCSMLRSIVRSNLDSFQRIAREWIDFILYHHTNFDYFPSKLIHDDCIYIMSFLTYDEKEKLISQKKIVHVLKQMIAKKNQTFFKKQDVIKLFLHTIRHKNFSKKEKSILQALKHVCLRIDSH